MRKEDREVKAPQTQVASLKIVFASIFMGASMLLDLYAMINYSNLLWLIAVLSLIFVASVYFFSSSIIQLRYSTQSERDGQYNDLYNSSKATYLMMKKYFEEIRQQVDSIDDKIDIPQEEMINVQKSIAKISINRSKENADALMNSNDRLLEKIFEFEEQLNKIEEKVAGENTSSGSLQEVLVKQQELTDLLKEVEVALKREIISINGRISSEPEVTASTYTAGSDDIPEAYAQPEPEHNELSNDMLDDLITKAEEELDIQSAGIYEEMSQPGEVISMDAQAVSEEEPEPESEVLLAEPSMEEEPEIPIEPEMAEVLEEPVEEEIPAEPEQEGKPAMPDLSDPNHVMTPDEIAALLANM